MSELNAFVEESVEPEVEIEAVVEADEPVVEVEVEPEAEGEEVEAVAEVEVEEGSPTEPNKDDERGSVPIKALMAEREKRQSYERQIAELQGKISSQSAPTPAAEVSSLPTLESFGYDEEKYAEAVSSYYANQVDSMLTKREQQREAERAQAELGQKLNEFNAKGMALGEDYKALVMDNDLLPVTEVMRGAFLRAENGAEVLLQLARGGQLDRISQMPKEDQSFEIGVLSERMKRATESKPDPKPDAIKKELPTSITSIRAQGGNTAPAVNIPDPLETTFNR